MVAIENAAALQRQYLANGYVVIPNFLPAEIAERVHSFLAGSMPEDWWFAAVRLPDTSRQYFQRTPANQDAIETHARAASAAFALGRFCYFYFRTLSDHRAACGCQVCMAQRLLAAPETREALRSVTATPLRRANECFASRYDPGCFLGVHTDADQGRVAFVWNLTKDWHPQWGGELHLLERGGLRTSCVIHPDFNTLVLLDIAGPPEKPHFVSRVAPGVMTRRLALSGWYA